MFMQRLARDGIDRFWNSLTLGVARRELDEGQKGELRAQQLRALVGLSPVLMAANIFNAVVIDALFWNSSFRLFLVVWTSALVLSVATWGDRWRRSRMGGARRRASVRGVRVITFSAFLFGVVWAMPMLAMFSDADAAQRVLLVGCEIGMICGGALALGAVWQAAFVFALTVQAPVVFVLCSAGDRLYFGLAALSLSFSLLIGRVVRERSGAFAEHFVSSLRLRDSGQVISLLLREFEENSNDWLFEVDASGRLTRASERHARLFGRSRETLRGAAAIELLAEMSREDAAAAGPALRALKRAFRRRLPFREILLPVRVNGERRWWSLRGNPVLREDGAFAGFRGVGADVTQAKRSEESIDRMASYDGLTGLPNRNLLAERLERRLEQQAKGGDGFALLSLDLDRFKHVNDTLGHQTGDALLIEVANRIRGELGAEDVVARFGGDEFVVLQAHAADAAEPRALAQRLVQRLGAPYEVAGQRILVGASIGVALAPADGKRADELLRNSDLALYRAKMDGKGRFSLFAAEMDAAMQQRRLMEIDLRDAIENQRLEVHFQPLIDMTTGQISACEALVRWNHPVRGAISPSQFIPLAEETGLIAPLGEFVLRVACREAASWKRDLRIAVNLSVVQFRSGLLVESVAAALADAGLRADRLELEVTESILIEDRDEALKTLTALRGLGVRISLDDFGTGYSSLSYLSSFPFDKIKIDQSFVRDVANRSDAAAIIKAISALASTLGMSTTAEGVEEADELEWLRANGCSEAQGFLFSKAVPARDLKLLLGLGDPVETKPARIDAA